MKQIIAILLLAALAVLHLPAHGTSGEIYKWTDENGNIQFSDKPVRGTQAVNAKKVTPRKDAVINLNATDVQPVERDKRRAQAGTRRSDQKVVLYATEWCPYCEKARQWFRENGITYTEIDIEKDAAAKARMKTLNPGGGVPTVQIGEKVIAGYSPQEMAAALGR